MDNDNDDDEDFCQACGTGLRLTSGSPWTLGIPVRDDDTGERMVLCPSCLGSVEGVTLL